MNDKSDEVRVKVVDRRWWARTEGADPSNEDEPARKPTMVEDLEQQLTDARSRIQELTTGHRQALEEFEQVKVRIRRDVAREVERGRRTVLLEMLEVLDNLDRAVAAAGDSTGTPAVEQFVRGVSLVRDQFLIKLEGFGVKRVPAVGQAFDALHHEAVTTTPVPSPAEDGIVVAVVKEGYVIGDEVLRPASVVVGRHEH